MPRRWSHYALYLDGRLAHATPSDAEALDVYLIASTHVPRRYSAVHLVACRGPTFRVLLRRPRTAQLALPASPCAGQDPAGYPIAPGKALSDLTPVGRPGFGS
jgi:hypothetical protein